MAAQTNAAPVIIRRKKIISGGGHHGGAWKVAYADFVTAMMAFFMLMWLLNATTEEQRKGIADYFTPTVAINRVSGGGNGVFSGDSIFSEMTKPQNGTGASAQYATEDDAARGKTGTAENGPSKAAEDETFKSIEEMLQGYGGETMVMENVMRHIVTKITDEGLTIEIFDLDDIPLFEDGTDTPTPILHDLSILIADVSRTVTNKMAISGYVRSNPVVLANNPVWELSAERATRMRLLLQDDGFDTARMQRVTGYADRKPAVTDPMARRNNRLEIVLLRN